MSDVYILTVEKNFLPLVTSRIGTLTAKLNEEWTYDASNTFTDANADDTLTLSASNTPSWVLFDKTLKRFSGTPTVDAEYNVTLTADDGWGGQG